MVVVAVEVEEVQLIKTIQMKTKKENIDVLDVSFVTVSKNNDSSSCFVALINWHYDPFWNRINHNLSFVCYSSYFLLQISTRATLHSLARM